MKKETKNWMIPELWTISPAEAEMFLGNKAPSQRPLKAANIKSMANDISAGRWQVTHQGIAFNAKGQLVDGQNRLSAVVMSNVPIDTLVFFQVPYGYAAPLDTGAKRTVSDVLQQHTTWSVAVTELYKLEYMVRTGSFYPNMKVSPGEVQDTYIRNKEDVDAIMSTGKDSAGMRLTGGVLGAAMFVHGFFPQVKDFLESLKSGARLDVDSPELTLRTWLAAPKIRRQPHQVALGTLCSISCKIRGSKQKKVELDSAAGFKYLMKLRVQ